MYRFFRWFFGFLGYHLHFQNLNTKYWKGNEEVCGSALIHSRCSIWKIWHDKNGSEHMDLDALEVSLEWLLFDFSLGFSISLDPYADQDLSIGFSIPLLITMCWGFKSKRLNKFAEWILPKKEYNNSYLAQKREIRFAVHHWALWWSVWVDGDSWYSSTPRYRQGSFYMLDFLFGDWEFESEVCSKGQILIPMPEKSYEGEYKIEYCKRYRKRLCFWPFQQTFHRSEFQCKEGIPHPGKGENSWDCGEDCTYGITAPNITDKWELIGSIVESVMRSRIRYGGSEKWVPQEEEDLLCSQS